MKNQTVRPQGRPTIYHFAKLNRAKPSLWVAGKPVALARAAAYQFCVNNGVNWKFEVKAEKRKGKDGVRVTRVFASAPRAKQRAAEAQVAA